MSYKYSDGGYLYCARSSFVMYQMYVWCTKKEVYSLGCIVVLQRIGHKGRRGFVLSDEKEKRNQGETRCKVESRLKTQFPFFSWRRVFNFENLCPFSSLSDFLVWERVNRSVVGVIYFLKKKNSSTRSRTTKRSNFRIFTNLLAKREVKFISRPMSAPRDPESRCFSLFLLFLCFFFYFI